MVINGINQSRAFEYKELEDWTRFATATNFKTTFSMDGETVESVYSVKKDDADETTNGFYQRFMINRFMYMRMFRLLCKVVTVRLQRYSIKMK